MQTAKKAEKSHRRTAKSGGRHLQESVIDAIDAMSGDKGSSLRDIENFMKSDGRGAGPSSASILSQLQEAVDNGTLSVKDGKYKINERARRRRSRRRGRSRRRSGTGSRSGSRSRSRSRRRSRSRKSSGGRRRRRRSRKPHKGHVAGDGCGL